jgi:hypothetical protein
MPRGPRVEAPHGYEDDGVTPKAPYGFNIDGTPRKSGRGRRPGAAGVKAKPAMTAKPSSLSDQQRVGMLGELLMQFVVAPLATASQVPAVRSRLGKHADALAGDAFILSQTAQPVFEGLTVMSKQKPKLLAWMDKIEENAGMAMVISGLIGAGKAIAANHMNPSPGMADAGRNLARMHMEALAAQVNEQAAAQRAQMEAAAARTAAAGPEPSWEQTAQANSFRDEPTLQFQAA